MTGIAVGTAGPLFARIHNSTTRSVSEEDRNGFAILVNGGSIVRLGASIAYLLELAEVG
jgi:hypothetical protein